MQKIKIGLAGLGTVGGGVWNILKKHRSSLKGQLGVPLEITKIAVRSKQKRRGVKVPSSLLTTKLEDLIQDPEIKIIVELIGDVKAARKLALSAMRAGKSIITANKALLALHGKELFTAAHQNQVDLCFEAAVAGGIPILRALREGFAANQIHSLHGIVNGTCNYILSEMAQKGSDFTATLQQAQKLGYAEADPSFDVDGIDAAHKLVILIALAYGRFVKLSEIFVEGIRQITALDLDMAQRFGYEIKLLAMAGENKGSIQARVHPTMVPKSSMLAAVQGVNNAVLLDGDFVGESMLYGQGAGAGPTASAVVGDMIEVARNLLTDAHHTVPPLGANLSLAKDTKIQNMGDLQSAYYLRFQALDRPGVLAKITTLLGKHQISISSVYQHGREAGKEVPIMVLTHEAKEKNVQKAVEKINQMVEIKKKTMLIRTL